MLGLRRRRQQRRQRFPVLVRMISPLCILLPSAAVSRQLETDHRSCPRLTTDSGFAGNRERHVDLNQRTRCVIGACCDSRAGSSADSFAGGYLASLRSFSSLRSLAIDVGAMVLRTPERCPLGIYAACQTRSWRAGTMLPWNIVWAKLLQSATGPSEVALHRPFAGARSAAL